MTTATLTRPDVVSTATTGPLEHLWCCDPDVAMCGKDVTGFEDHQDRCGCTVCPDCRRVQKTGAPCPVAGCTGEQVVLIGRLLGWLS